MWILRRGRGCCCWYGPSYLIAKRVLSHFSHVELGKGILPGQRSSRLGGHVSLGGDGDGVPGNWVVHSVREGRDILLSLSSRHMFGSSSGL